MITLQGKYLVSGLGFSGNGNPYLKLDRYNQFGQLTRQYMELFGSKFQVTRLKRRICKGPYSLVDFSDYPCPLASQLPLDSNHDQCYQCQQQTGFNPAFYHVKPEQLSPQQRAYNSQQHVVYIAIFSEQLKKIGISHHARFRVRWREQGAKCALVVAKTANATDARLIESQLSKALFFPEAIHSKTKRKMLFESVSVPRVLAQLQQQSEENSINFQLPTCADDITQLHFDYYHDRRLPVVEFIDDLTNQLPISIGGKVIGLQGSILIMLNDNVVQILDLKKLLGYVCLFSGDIDMPKAESTQGSLI